MTNYLNVTMAEKKQVLQKDFFVIEACELLRRSIPKQVPWNDHIVRSISNDVQFAMRTYFNITMVQKYYKKTSLSLKHAN